MTSPAHRHVVFSGPGMCAWFYHLKNGQRIRCGGLQVGRGGLFARLLPEYQPDFTARSRGGAGSELPACGERAVRKFHTPTVLHADQHCPVGFGLEFLRMRDFRFPSVAWSNQLLVSGNTPGRGALEQRAAINGPRACRSACRIVPVSRNTTPGSILRIWRRHGYRGREGWFTDYALLTPAPCQRRDGVRYLRDRVGRLRAVA